MEASSSDDEIFLTQRHYKVDTDYDTDNLVSDILGLEEVQPNLKKPVQNEPYAPQCSDINDADDDLLVLTAEKVEKECRFGDLKTDKEISELQTKQFAPATRSKIRWAVSTFREWQRFRNEMSKSRSDISPILVDIDKMTMDELNYTVSRFMCEAKKVDGSEHPPETLYSFVICLQLYMDTLGYNYKFLIDDEFSQIKNTLDNVMKSKAKDNVGGAKKQALPITEDEEDILWSKGILGDTNPEQLLYTLLYLIGLHFALRGGQEHRILRRGDRSQLSVSEDAQGKFLSYTEDTSKSNQGGLKHRKISQKSVQAYENKQMPNRCIVKYYEKYISKCPDVKVCDAFYLRPLAKPTEEQWYSVQPIGRHKLANVVSDLCKQGGLHGFRTNHSLRASAATRLYHAGVDEQLISEVTGHRSNAIRNYKRTTAAQKRNLSEILQGHKDIDIDINNNSHCKCVRSGSDFQVSVNVSFNKK